MRARRLPLLASFGQPARAKRVLLRPGSDALDEPEIVHDAQRAYAECQHRAEQHVATAPIDGVSTDARPLQVAAKEPAGTPVSEAARDQVMATVPQLAAVLIKGIATQRQRQQRCHLIPVSQTATASVCARLRAGPGWRPAAASQGALQVPAGSAATYCAALSLISGADRMA